MANKSRRLAQRVLVAAVTLAIGTAVEAVFVKGVWDPSFEIGGTLERLGWRGEAVFVVSDACLNAQSPGSTGVWVGDGVCDMNLVSAFTDLYDFYDPATPTLDTVTFAPPPVLPDPVLGFFVEDVGGVNTVTGVDTNDIGPKLASVFSAYDASCTDHPSDCGPGSIYFGPVWMYLSSGHLPDPAFLKTGSCDDIEAFTGCVPESTSQGATVRFTQIAQIPEPGTLALLLGGLGGGWLARRRSKTA